MPFFPPTSVCLTHKALMRKAHMPKLGTPHQLTLSQLTAGSRQDDAPGLEHIATVGDRPSRRDLPHPRALQPRGPLPRPLPRGARHRARQSRAGARHALLSPHDEPGRRRTHARPHRGRAGRGPRRHVRQLSYNLSSTRLTILLPQWTHDGGYERLKAVLADPKRSVTACAPRWGPAPRAGRTCGSRTSGSPRTIGSRAARSPRPRICSTRIRSTRPWTTLGQLRQWATTVSTAI